MNLKEKIKFRVAKLLGKKTVLFSKKDPWEKHIRNRLKHYEPFFCEFDEIKLDDFDIVIPLTLKSQNFLNAHSGVHKRHKKLVPSDDCMALCNDKERFQKFLVNHGFDQYVPKINEKFSYPYLLKKNEGAWGEDTFIINNKQNEIEHKNLLASDKYFKQEYIPGHTEYTAHFIVDKNKIVFLKVLQFTFKEAVFIKGKNFKNKTIREIDHRELSPIFEAILNQIQYQGIGCFNYKLDQQVLKIFEINPRFGFTMNRFINEAIDVYDDLSNN